MISVHFYEADSLLGRLVGRFGKTKYVHCAVQVDGKHIIETDAFQRVQMKHLYKKPSKVVWVKDVSEHDVMVIYNALMSRPYDYAAVLEFLGLAVQDGYRLTCVELCQALLYRPIHNLTPDAFYRSILEE